jgi:hypothetical protein
LDFLGYYAAAKSKAVKEIQKDLQTELQQHIIIYSGEGKSYTEALSMTDSHEPWFYLLNPQGDIIWMDKGRYSAKKLQAAEARVED